MPLFQFAMRAIGASGQNSSCIETTMQILINHKQKPTKQIDCTEEKNIGSAKFILNWAIYTHNRWNRSHTTVSSVWNSVSYLTD